MSDEIPDLFGGAVAVTKRGRGRPAHVPTRENVAKIARLLRAGCPKVQIAKSLGITMPTFRRHYFRANSEKKSNTPNTTR